MTAHEYNYFICKQFDYYLSSSNLLNSSKTAIITSIHNFISQFFPISLQQEQKSFSL